MRKLFFLLLLLCCCAGFAQQVNDTLAQVKSDSILIVADPKYREDQFYASLAYVLLMTQPQGFSQTSFSTNLTWGFLRDMPVNKARTYAVALGLGYSYSNIKHNLKTSGTGDNPVYEIAEEFDKNKLVLHYLELPIEFRWRSSDAVSHKFLRVYTGFKVSYLVYDKTQFYPNEGETIKITGNTDLNKLVYGAYVSIGWNTWNAYAYYGLNPIYKSGALSPEEPIKINNLHLGLIFYIL